MNSAITMEAPGTSARRTGTSRRAYRSVEGWTVVDMKQDWQDWKVIYPLQR
jgi:hypothetical protein